MPSLCISKAGEESQEEGAAVAGQWSPGKGGQRGEAYQERPQTHADSRQEVTVRDHRSLGQMIAIPLLRTVDRKQELRVKADPSRKWQIPSSSVLPR